MKNKLWMFWGCIGQSTLKHLMLMFLGSISFISDVALNGILYHMVFCVEFELYLDFIRMFRLSMDEFLFHWTLISSCKPFNKSAIHL